MSAIILMCKLGFTLIFAVLFKIVISVLIRLLLSAKLFLCNKHDRFYQQSFVHGWFTEELIFAN